jgi:hypothetical protein
MVGERTFVVASELAEALGPHLDSPPLPISLSLSPYRRSLLHHPSTYRNQKGQINLITANSYLMGYVEVQDVKYIRIK